MVAKGLLTAQVMDQVYSAAGARRQAIFDGQECERDYLDYEDRKADPSDPVGRRPRSYLDLRPAVLKALRAVQTPIPFGDAIGVAEGKVQHGLAASRYPERRAVILAGSQIGFDTGGDAGKAGWVKALCGGLCADQ
jgi:hypothetical protein